MIRDFRKIVTLDFDLVNVSFYNGLVSQPFYTSTDGTIVDYSYFDYSQLESYIKSMYPNSKIKKVIVKSFYATTNSLYPAWVTVEDTNGNVIATLPQTTSTSKANVESVIIDYDTLSNYTNPIHMVAHITAGGVIVISRITITFIVEVYSYE